MCVVLHLAAALLCLELGLWLVPASGLYQELQIPAALTALGTTYPALMLAQVDSPLHQTFLCEGASAKGLLCYLYAQAVSVLTPTSTGVQAAESAGIL